MARWRGRETDLCILRKMQIDEIKPSLRRGSSDRKACPVPSRLRVWLGPGRPSWDYRPGNTVP